MLKTEILQLNTLCERAIGIEPPGLAEQIISPLHANGKNRISGLTEMVVSSRA